MKRILLFIFALLALLPVSAAGKYNNPDTLFVARDGTAEFRNIDDAIEVCRAFMEYHKVIFVKRGTYKEKLVIPSWLTNIEICGEDRDQTIITYDDHANIRQPGTERKMGTFRTYTLKICGSNITLKNITVENNAARLGQAVALHTEGNHLVFINCRFLGNQDTVYTGVGGTLLYFYQCYIEGTTDFIFGPSTAWFEQCTIHSKADSYITAASTPQSEPYGYVFHRCTLTADPSVTRVYLGRPWRPYAYTLFIYSTLGRHIRPEGWHNWNNPANEQTARYMEYGNDGPGAVTEAPKTTVQTVQTVPCRVAWSQQLTKKQAAAITRSAVFHGDIDWLPKE